MDTPVHVWRDVLPERYNAEQLAKLAESTLDLGKSAEAMAYCRRALELDARCMAARITLGVALVNERQLAEAVEQFRHVTAIEPNCVAAWANLASALHLLGRHAEALTTYRETLRIDPGNALARHMIGVLGGAAASAAPAEYVRELFDGYAATFEEHLVEQLRYATPGLLAGQIAQVSSPAPQSLDVLDIGCGTGLCGEAVRPWSRHLVGVDLSSGMLDIARRKGTYDRLECRDALQSLASEVERSFDLVLAADVLVYFGDLSALLAGVRRVLRSDGLFAFSVESLEAGPGPAGNFRQDYSMGPFGRYLHAESYLRRIAPEHRFRFAAWQSCTLRLERGNPVRGWVGVLAATPLTIGGS